MIKLKDLIIEANTFQSFEKNTFEMLWRRYNKFGQEKNMVEYGVKSFDDFVAKVPEYFGFVLNSMKKNKYTDQRVKTRGLCKVTSHYCYTNALDYYNRFKNEHSDLKMAGGILMFSGQVNRVLNGTIGFEIFNYLQHGFCLDGKHIVDPTLENDSSKYIYFYDIVPDNVISLALKKKKIGDQFKIIENFIDQQIDKNQYNSKKAVEKYFSEFLGGDF